MRLRKMGPRAAVLMLALGASTISQAAEWHINPSAVSGGDGSATSPYSGLVEARDRIREIRSVRPNSELDTVWLHAGEYQLEATFELTQEDGGTAEAPIHWRAAAGTTPKIFGEQLSVLVAVYDTEHLTLEGLSLSDAVDQAIEVAHCHHVSLVACQVRNIGDTGLHLFGGRECVIRNCKLSDCGRLGIRVEAGDRTTLASANHQVAECLVQRCGGGELPQTAAIHVAGVGCLVSNNRLSECNDAGIRVDGNDHRIVENHLQRVCLTATDVGAIYLGHDWTERGISIERNVISQVGHSPRLDAIAIYLDDFASGTVIQGNVISAAGRGIAIGGGNHNLIRENLIEDCIVGIQVDSRGETWLAEAVNPDTGFVGQAWSALEAAAREVYFERYPEMRDFEDQTSVAAFGNRIEANLLQRCGRVAVDSKRTLAQNHVVKNQFGTELFALDLVADEALRVHVSFPGSVHPQLVSSGESTLEQSSLLAMDRAP